jgi:hypothetical protein
MKKTVIALTLATTALLSGCATTPSKPLPLTSSASTAPPH